MKDWINQNRDKLQKFIDCINVGIFVADEKGNILIINETSSKTGSYGYSIIGRNVFDLVKTGYMSDSAIARSLKSGTTSNIIQELENGEALYITGTPLYENGEIKMSMATERDNKEAHKLKEQLIETKKIAKLYETELDHFKSKSGYVEGIVAKSNIMKRVVGLALRIAKSNSTVMINGESGTGKELIANLIQSNSARKDKPFIKVNCSAIPESLLESELFGYEKGAFTGADDNGKVGLFELAHGGIMFLDEIGDMPYAMQAKLLRVLQEKEFMRIGGSSPIPTDVRILAATNLDLIKAMEKKEFREDLYYRLNVGTIEMPPLRKRKEDISVLARHFAEEINKENGTSKTIIPQTITALETYDWPGNVRELKNVVERAMISFDSNEVTPFQIESQLRGNEDLNNLFFTISDTKSLKEKMGTIEKEIITQVLQTSKSISQAARELGLDKSTLSRKIKKYGI